MGNANLVPEAALQVGADVRLTLRPDGWELGLRVSPYYNRVSNKIVAIPTLSQFRWTMLNVGLVDITGADVKASAAWHSGPWRASGTLPLQFPAGAGSLCSGQPDLGEPDTVYPPPQRERLCQFWVEGPGVHLGQFLYRQPLVPHGQHAGLLPGPVEPEQRGGPVYAPLPGAGRGWPVRCALRRPGLAAGRYHRQCVQHPLPSGPGLPHARIQRPIFRLLPLVAQLPVTANRLIIIALNNNPRSNFERGLYGK